MTVHLKQRGDYELFLTEHQNRILALDGERFFAWVETQQGDLLVRSNPGHRKERTLRRGRFYFADFEHEPKFKDMPHLFLQRDDRFEELMLPNGLPTDSDPQKKIVKTDETLAVNELESYVEKGEGGGEAVEARTGAQSAGAEAAKSERPSFGGEPPSERRESESGRPEVAGGSQAMQTRDTFAREEMRREGVERGPEGAESAPRTSTPVGGARAEGRREEGAKDTSFGTPQPERERSEQTRSFGLTGMHPDLPIQNFNELSVKVARRRLEGLNRDELRRLREFEESHKNRKTMLEAIDRRLGNAPKDAERKSAGTSW